MIFFSIVIPLYNRAALVTRVVNSCLSQGFSDFEIIVVDDGSQDGSCQAVEAIHDTRVILLRHNFNRGVCPARNTGIAHARGEWILPIDSDDELIPGVLAKVHQLALDLSPDVAMIRFMNRMSSGEISPDPPLNNEIWTYEGYLRWAESTLDAKRSDASKIFRRSCFEHVRYPEDRTLEAMFHLDFSQRFKTLTSTVEMVLVHQDAKNRLTRPDISRTIASAPGMVHGMEALLTAHGEAMRRWAPRIYFQNLCGLATVQFLSRLRSAGLKTCWKALKLSPGSLRSWTILIIGLLGAEPLAWLQAERMRRRQRP